MARRVDGAPVDDSCAAGASEALARAMYRDLVGRVGDEGGVGYWSGQLESGTSGGSVASSLMATAEARTELVRDTYDVWSCVEEPPTADEVAEGAAFSKAGGSIAVLRSEVVAATVPDDGDPVDCLYGAVLGRAPDPGGRAYVEDQLDAGRSVERMAQKMVATTEGRRVRFNRIYRHLLGRNAAAEEVAAGVAAIRGGPSEQALFAAIAGSEEYSDRTQ